MQKANDIYNFLDKTFPYNVAEKDDNSGIIVWDKDKEIKKCLISLDITLKVIQEAIKLGCDLIISHHPIIFEPLKAVSDDDLVGKKISLLIKNDILAISCHTNLDIARGGLNDILANKLGLNGIESFLNVDDYINKKQQKPSYLGRIGTVEKTNLIDFAKKVKAILNCEKIRYCDGGKDVHKVAVIGGSGATYYSRAIKAGADTLVSADAKYSAFLPSMELGFNLIDAGHFCTENIVIKPLCEMLKKEFSDLEFIISKENSDCIKYI